MGAQDHASAMETRRRETALTDPKHGHKAKDLEQLNKTGKEARKRVMTKCLEVQHQIDQSQAETQEINERIAWAKARRLWWKHMRNQSKPENMTQDEIVEHEALDKIQSEMTDLKVDIEAKSL